ncbi:NinE family protein [Escherichia coli]
MARQRRSITDIICENCKYLPTKRTRNKPKPIPKESDVKTFNYTAGNDSNLLIVFYVQIMPDDFVMQFHRF